MTEWTDVGREGFSQLNPLRWPTDEQTDGRVLHLMDVRWRILKQFSPLKWKCTFLSGKQLPDRRSSKREKKHLSRQNLFPNLMIKESKKSYREDNWGGRKCEKGKKTEIKDKIWKKVMKAGRLMDTVLYYLIYSLLLNLYFIT